MTYLSRKTSGPFQQVVDKVVHNLHAKGFDIVNTIDMQGTLLDTLHIPFRNYQILGICHPAMAYKAISMESHLGAILQSNVVVQEHENGEVEITAVNPLEYVDKAYTTLPLEHLSREISSLLREALDDIRRESPEYHEEALPVYDMPSPCQMPIQG